MILKNGNLIVKYIDIRRLGDFEYVVVEYDKTGHKLYDHYFNEEATDELGDYLRSRLYDCYENYNSTSTQKGDFKCPGSINQIHGLVKRRVYKMLKWLLITCMEFLVGVSTLLVLFVAICVTNQVSIPIYMNSATITALYEATGLFNGHPRQN